MDGQNRLLSTMAGLSIHMTDLKQTSGTHPGHCRDLHLQRAFQLLSLPALTQMSTWKMHGYMDVYSYKKRLDTGENKNCKEKKLDIDIIGFMGLLTE